MAKRKIMRRSNRPFTYNPHYYSWGGDFKAAMGGTGAFDLKSTFSGGNVAGMLKGGLASGIGSAVGNTIGGAISGGLESGAGSAISNIGGTIGGAVGAVNPALGGIISAGTGIVAGLTNRMFGSKLNKEKIAEVEGINKAINTVMVDNSSADSIEDQWLNQDFGTDFSKSDIGKDGWFSNKAKNKYKSLKTQQGIARNRALTAFENAADAADMATDLNAAANFSAYGGPLDLWGIGGGAIGYELAKEDLGIKAMNALSKNKITSLPNSFTDTNTFASGGKIYIRPENRGKFTALKERTGKSATWFKEHGTPAQKKMATFALNSRKWKHDDGGPLEEENSSNSNYKMEPIYIGGTTSEARKKYFNLDKELTQVVTNLATSYGISPALVIDRLAHEGIIDTLIRDHNINIKHRGEEEPSRAFSTDMFNSPYGLFGLDTIFDTYTKGITKTKRPINFRKFSTFNESGEAVNSGFTNNIYDTLELFVAELASRRNQVQQQYPNLTDEELDSATAARYNATNRYFKQLMDSGEYKIKYPIDIEGINIPAPTKIDSKYIKDQSKEFNLNSTFRGMFDDEYIYDNKSWNPKLFLEDGKVINPNDKIVKGILEGYAKRNFSEPEQVKFVQDKGKPGFAKGGNLFTNGVTTIGNGGTHEENPYEGVQMGVDNQGIPNLVEEGEVVFNDYVFSNRLTVPDAVREKYKLRGNKELTFADAAKQMQKESEERPNDPISKRGLESAMLRLQQAQETVREEKQASQEGVQYAYGGRMGTLFDGTGDKPNIMARAKAKRLGYDVGNSLESYFKDPVYENEDTNKGFDLTQLRYAPVVGAAIGLGQNLFSKPDYSSTDAILEAANQVGNYTPIGYTPIGNYLQYRPFDRNFYLNKLNAQAGATRRAIMNTTSPSRNAALLAADYNAQGRLGDLARQAEEYNLAQRQAVEQFNRATNQANAEMGLKAAMANQEAALKARSSRLSGVAQAMAMRDAIDNRRSASMSANLSNLFESLGNIGVDEMNRADSDFYIKYVMGANLPLEEYRRRYGLDAAKKEAKKRGFTDNEITKLFLKNGGKLKKRRGGLTY